MKKHAKLTRRLVLSLAAAASPGWANAVDIASEGAAIKVVASGAKQAAATAVKGKAAKLWFVELRGKPLARHSLAETSGARIALLREHDAFRGLAKLQGIAFREHFAFNNLWNGFSVAADNANIGRIAKLSGVKAVYPVHIVSLPPQPRVSAMGTLANQANPEVVPQNPLASALAMTGADIVQTTLGYTGQGVKVGIIDTGIDYDHPDLGGCFGAGCKVAGGYDFVGDAYDANDPAPVITPDPDPDDCGGHGTHVAGIIAATGATKVKGVAPDATLYAYRVFGCDGSVSEDIVIKALERAYADGVQVVNMSLGSGHEYPTSPEVTAVDNLVARGVTVVASAGNSGPTDPYATGTPGAARNAISTASFDNTSVYSTTAFRLSNNQIIGYSLMTFSVAPTDLSAFPLARTGTTSTVNDACNPLPLNSLTGMVALIRRGTCSFALKASNAQTAGAAGVAIYNNSPGFFTGTLGGPGITIPVVSITAEDGAVMDALIAAGVPPTPVPTLTWDNSLSATISNVSGGFVSSFSSLGLTYTLDVKPDLGAPGGLIYSTYPVEFGSYAMLSGTSMASPHAAGAVALLLQAKPGTAPETVKTLLKNSADPVLQYGSAALDNVHRQGAGLLDIDDALQAKTIVKPHSLALGESNGAAFVRYLQIENKNASSVIYNLSKVDALASNGEVFAGGVPAVSNTVSVPAAVSFSPVSVTVPANAKATVAVTITPPATPAKGLYGGYIVLTQQGSGQKFRVPYAGFIGDYQSVTVLKQPVGGSGYPKLQTCCSFTMSGGSFPTVLAHFEYGAKLVTLDLYTAGGALVGNIYKFNGFPSNAAANQIYGINWDGTLAGSAVANGDYYLKLRVLKPLGNASKPAESEIWQSPTFAIAR